MPKECICELMYGKEGSVLQPVRSMSNIGWLFLFDSNGLLRSDLNLLTVTVHN